jgi:hypothetical protein
VAFGFHLVVTHACPAEEVLRRLDEVVKALGFSSRASTEYGFKQRFYRQSDQHPELSVAFDFQPEHYELSMYPLEEMDVLAYSQEVLVNLWSNTGASLRAALGRTFLEIGYGTVQVSEIEGPLQFVDWYQYFSQRVVDRWGIRYLRDGPFHRVEEYANGACGIWLAKSPFERLNRRSAAEYLGVTLPKLFGKNPQTGEPMELSWN